MKTPALLITNLVCLLSFAAFAEETKQTVIAPPVNLYTLSKAETQNRTLDVDAIAAQNIEIFKTLHAIPTRVVAGRRDHITKEEAFEIVQNAAQNDIIGYHNHLKYDPKGNIGFCFGRAMYMHLNLLARGVNKSSIYKAFIIGSMKSDGITWGFHVTTIVRGENGTWLVLDPNFGYVQTVEDWFDYYRKLDVDNKLRLFITEANKFGASSGVYNPETLNNAFYNDYFKDMLGEYRENAAQKIKPNYITRPETCRDVF